MRDPELTCEVGPDGTFYSVSFTQDNLGAYHEAVFVDDAGRVMVRPRVLKDLAVFAREWDRNLAAQGFVRTAGWPARRIREDDTMPRTKSPLPCAGSPCSTTSTRHGPTTSVGTRLKQAVGAMEKPRRRAVRPAKSPGWALRRRARPDPHAQPRHLATEGLVVVSTRKATRE
jgi:hypothetical protein